MNENPYASPVEIPETLAEDARPRGELPPEMVWVKWGMMCVLVGCVAAIWPLFKLNAQNEQVAFIIFGVFHTAGMILCCRCPVSIVKSRAWLAGGCALLMGISVIGMVQAGPGIQSLVMIRVMIIPVAGTMWIWLFFLLKLTQGIHGGWTVWGAKRLLFVFSLVIILSPITSPSIFVTAIQIMVLQFSILGYPLLVFGIWWRIRRMLRHMPTRLV